MGHVPYEQMAAYYQAADVCVSIPSSDSSPRSVWEAMACGCPVVVSDLPWVHELIEPGCDALTVPIDAGALALAIDRILGDRELAAIARSPWPAAGRDASRPARRDGPSRGRLPKPRIVIATITDPGGVRRAAEEWDALVAEMRRPSPFLLHGWLLEWWRHHSDRGRLTVHVAREGDRITGALPLFVQRRAGLRVARFLGGDAAALADVLVADGAEASTADRLLDQAAGSGADFADLFGLPEQSRLGDERLRLISRAEAPVMDLAAGWDAAYRAKTSAKRRNLHGRRRRQLEGFGDVTFDVARDLEELSPALEDAFRLHAARWRDRPEASGFATPRGRAFHRAALAALAPLGCRGSPSCAWQAVPSPATTSSCSTAACTSTSSPSTLRSRGGHPARSRRSRRSGRRRRSGSAASSSSAAASATSWSSPHRLEPLHQGLGLATTRRGRIAVAARLRAVDARRRLKRTPLRRLYYEGLAPARRMARLASSSTSARRGTSAPGRSPDRAA